MSAFDATLFGVDAASFRTFGLSLITPALGFSFLYLLGKPLAKIPFLDIETGYVPPRWVLPLFAFGSLATLTFSLSSSLFLQSFHTMPDLKRFKEQYQKAMEYDVDPGPARILDSSITLKKYDMFSNFYIYVNGYRIFSSEVNCLMRYQCRMPSISTEKDYSTIDSISFLDNSLHNVHKLYDLPHRESISEYFVAGKNIVDIVSVNSGIGDCAISLNFSLRTTISERLPIF